MTWDLYCWKCKYNVNLRYDWALILLKKLIVFYIFYYSWWNASCCIYSYLICYCLLHNLPSKYLLIPSTADFVSMWRRIKGVQRQILLFHPSYTGRVMRRWLPDKYHSLFLICKDRFPFHWFTGVFYWKDKVREIWYGETDKEKFKID